MTAFWLFTAVLVTVCCFGHGRDCVTRDVGGRLEADCSCLNLNHVPQNLSVDIIKLNLSSNLIQDISNNSFINYPYLQSLSLSNNTLSIVDPNGFEGLRNLEILDLSRNNIDISADSGRNILRHIKNITTLDLSRKIQPIEGQFIYPDKEFQHLKHLENLYIDLFASPVFREGFRQLTLLSIEFNKCYILRLTNTTFKHLPKSLQILGLRNCNPIMPNKIETGIFEAFPNLMSLDMSWTKISVLIGLKLLYPFQNKNMTTINFSHMKTPRVKPYALTIDKYMLRYIKTICVKRLSLADNNIVEYLPDTLFSLETLHCLEHIDLSGNRFGFGNVQPLFEIIIAAGKLTNIKTFDMSYMPLKFINERFLDITNPNGEDKNTSPLHKHSNWKYCEGLRNMTYILYLPQTVEFIRITHIMGSVALPRLMLSNGKNLKRVDMSYFQFQCFPEIVLNNTNNLEYLDLSGIPCRQYYNKSDIQLFYNLRTLIMRNVDLYEAIKEDKNILRFSRQLETLDLSENRISKIPYNFMQPLNTLLHFRLSRNRFRIIPYGVMSLPKLRSLDMIDNRLYALDDTLMKWFDSQQKKIGRFDLKMTANDFYCSCEHRDFIRWLHTTNVSLDKNGNYPCRLADGSVSSISHVNTHFHDIFSNCESKIWLKVGIILITTFFLIFLPITILFNFRWRIIIFMYRTFRKFVEKGMDLTYEYDVYVAYGCEGYEWVKMVLLPLLEKKWNLKVCLEDREFVGNAGQLQCNLIQTAVGSSRHMVFVVTSDYISKALADFEIDCARAEKMGQQNLQQLIVIAMDIKIAEIPKQLQSIWSSVSLLEWSDDEEKQKTVVENLKTRLFLNF